MKTMDTRHRGESDVLAHLSRPYRGNLDYDLSSLEALTTSADSTVKTYGVSYNRILKIFEDQNEFAREVFFFVTLKELWCCEVDDGPPEKLTIRLPSIFTIDQERQRITYFRIPDPKVIEDKANLFAVHSFLVNDFSVCHGFLERPGHLLASGSTGFVIDFKHASYFDSPFCFAALLGNCPFHPIGSCHVSHPESWKGCSDALIPSRIRGHRRLAVCIRGACFARVTSGSHASMSKDALIVASLPPVLHSVQKAIGVARLAGCEVDVYIHGWYEEEFKEECEKWAKSLNAKATIFEPLSKSFEDAYTPYLKDEVAPECSHLTRTPVNLQRWWSTYYSTFQAFSLMEASREVYDLVISHRADMIVPSALSYAALTPTALTILMKQNPRNLNFAAVGYHDWWVAGPPIAMKAYAHLYKDLKNIFSDRRPIHQRSIHTVLRDTMAERGIDVECLCFRFVAKAFGTQVGEGSYSANVLGVQSQCRRRECCGMMDPDADLAVVKLELIGDFPFAIIIDWIAFQHNVTSVTKKSIIVGSNGDEKPLGVAFEFLMESSRVKAFQGIECPYGLSKIIRRLNAWRGCDGESYIAFQTSLDVEKTVKILL